MLYTSVKLYFSFTVCFYICPQLHCLGQLVSFINTHPKYNSIIWK